MSTGYTARLYDGEDTTFAEFAVECARAFGALIDLRDIPSAEIPEVFAVDPRKYERIESARAKLESWKNITPEELIEKATEDHNSFIKREYELAVRRNGIRDRYDSMLEKVTLWNPPTDEHVELKKFMIEQLEESIKHDCRDYVDLESLQVELAARPLDVQEYRQAMIISAERWLDYTVEELDQDEDRAKGKSKWIQELRASL